MRLSLFFFPLGANAYTVGTVTTLAGGGTTPSSYVDGTGTNAEFIYPSGIGFTNSAHTELHVGDSIDGVAVLRKIDVPAKTVTSYSFSVQGCVDGTGTNARIKGGRGFHRLDADNLIWTDQWCNAIRKLNIPLQVVTSVAGVPGANSVYADGQGTNANFNNAFTMKPSFDGSYFIITDNHGTLRKMTPNYTVTTLAGNGVAGTGYADGTGTNARFYYPKGVCWGPTGTLFIADGSNNSIRRVDMSASPVVVTTVAGIQSSGGYADGVGSNARFSCPTDCAFDKEKSIFVADGCNNRIRKVSWATTVTSEYTTTVLAGKGDVPDIATATVDGVGTNAAFYYPQHMAFDYGSGKVYIGDEYDRIRVVQVTAGTMSPTATPTASPTVTGSGSWYSVPTATAPAECKGKTPGTVLDETKCCTTANLAAGTASYQGPFDKDGTCFTDPTIANYHFTWKCAFKGEANFGDDCTKTTDNMCKSCKTSYNVLGGKCIYTAAVGTAEWYIKLKDNVCSTSPEQVFSASARASVSVGVLAAGLVSTLAML